MSVRTWTADPDGAVTRCCGRAGREVTVQDHGELVAEYGTRFTRTSIYRRHDDEPGWRWVRSGGPSPAAPMRVPPDPAAEAIARLPEGALPGQAPCRGTEGHGELAACCTLGRHSCSLSALRLDGNNRAQDTAAWGRQPVTARPEARGSVSSGRSSRRRAGCSRPPAPVPSPVPGGSAVLRDCRFPPPCCRNPTPAGGT